MADTSCRSVEDALIFTCQLLSIWQMPGGLPATLPSMLGPLEIGLIALVILLLFGARKLPELGKGLGRGIRGFKEETQGLNHLTTDARPTKSEVRAEGEVIDVPSTKLRAEDTASHVERP